jgi:oxygen-dependent protoporphyrinogen oxidase
MKKIVIIGAGIAGLSTALALEEEAVKRGMGLEITLLERRDRVGGNIKTERAGGFLIEGGPDCFLSEKPWAMALCKKLGLGKELLATNEKNKKTFVLSGGKLHELPEGFILMVPTRVMPFLKNSLISPMGKIRMGLELFVPRRSGASDESLGSFVRRRLGQEALDKIAEPLVAGVHAGDPETMSVRASFPKFVQMEAEHGSLIKGMLARMRDLHGRKPAGGAQATPASGDGRVTMFMTLRNGLSDLVNAITARLNMTAIRTGVNAVGVRGSEGGYLIDVEGEPGIKADAVVIAAPAYVASKLLERFDDALSAKLMTIPYVSTATVSLGYERKDIKHPLDGFGFVIPKTEKKNIMAASWVSVKFAGRAPDGSVLIRCFVGGAKNEELVFRGDEELKRLVACDLREIMGITAEPKVVRVYRWHKAMPQYTIGHEERVAAIDALAARHPGLYLGGSAYRGIGISDCIRTGEEIARKAAEFMEA